MNRFSFQPCLTIVLLVSLAGMNALAADMLRPSPAPDGASVYIIEPADGATVSRTFTVRFGLRGMGVAPAGVNLPGTGHHHLLVDAPAGLDLSKPLPASDTVRHFGKGQTETELTLTPGKHTLQLLLADHLHLSFDPPVRSSAITVTVE